MLAIERNVVVLWDVKELEVKIRRECKKILNIAKMVVLENCIVVCVYCTEIHANTAHVDLPLEYRVSHYKPSPFNFFIILEKKIIQKL